MDKISRFILKHKILILSVFIVLIALSVIGLGFVKTNSDITSYLPEDFMTQIGIEQLEDKFGIVGDTSIAVMNPDMDVLTEFVNRQIDLDFIKQVAWLGTFDQIQDMIDTTTNTTIKNAMQKAYNEAKNKFYYTSEEGKPIYIIAIYLTLPSTDSAVLDWCGSIKQELKEMEANGSIDEFALGGQVPMSKDMLDSSLGEVPIYLLIAIILMAAILLLTTKSWIEPLIFMATLGISVLLNAGSNMIFPEVSSITFSASIILQLALSMDYSIFLMHCYYDERDKDKLADARTALTRALPKTIKSVSASALTTIGGFIALFAMQFGMGADIGQVLAKGVALSLLTVIVLQPILILMMAKPISKTSHRYFKPQLKRPQKFAAKHSKTICALALIIAVPCLIGQFNVPLSYLTLSKEPTELSETQTIMKESSNQLIVIAPTGVTSSRHYKFLKEVGNIEGVGKAFSAYSLIDANLFPLIDSLAPEVMEALQGTFFSKGYSLYTFELTSGVESKVTYDAIDSIMASANTVFGEGKVFMTGTAQGAKDLASVTPTDFMIVTILSALIILLILLLTYRDVALSFILLFVIELGIWINLSIVTSLGLFVGLKINFMSYLIISAVQLGATVDYAILIASKYKEAKASGERNEIKAVSQAVRSASTSILVSASILISICLAVFFVTQNLIIGEITLLIAAGSAMSTALVVTLLPAILVFKEKCHRRKIDKRLLKLGVVPANEDLLGDEPPALDSDSTELEPPAYEPQSVANN